MDNNIVATNIITVGWLLINNSLFMNKVWISLLNFNNSAEIVVIANIVSIFLLTLSCTLHHSSDNIRSELRVQSISIYIFNQLSHILFTEQFLFHNISRWFQPDQVAIWNQLIDFVNGSFAFQSSVIEI